jgi:hypothetical protein
MADGPTQSGGGVGADDASEFLDAKSQDEARQALARQRYRDLSAEARLAREAGLAPSGENAAAVLNVPDQIPEATARAQWTEDTAEARELRTRVTAAQQPSGGVGQVAEAAAAQAVKRRILWVLLLSPWTWGLVVILLAIVLVVGVVVSQPGQIEQSVKIFGKDFVQGFNPSADQGDSEPTEEAPPATSSPQSGTSSPADTNAGGTEAKPEVKP